MKKREIASDNQVSHWMGIIRECKESGLSVKAFCERAGIRRNKYFYWKKKLREKECAEPARADSNSSSLAQTVFAEVKLPEQPTLSAEPVPANHICIEAGGMRITADGGYPVSQLSELLSSVMQPC